MFDQMKGELSSLEKELTTCRVERASEREQFSLKRKEDRARAEGERGEMELRHRQTVEELVTSHKATMEGQREELVTNKVCTHNHIHVALSCQYNVSTMSVQRCLCA